MKAVCLAISFFALISCQGSVTTQEHTNDPINTTSKINAATRSAEIKHIDAPELKVQYTDSANIGRKGKNKVEMNYYLQGDSAFVIVRFYHKKANDKWDLTTEMSHETSSIRSGDEQVSDFNNDGFNDITYISNTAARGANEIRTLLIYDNASDKLIHIRNSEHYPNMEYNKDLNCIDALLYHGTSTNVFLQIKGDSLVAFASADIEGNDGSGFYRTVSYVDKDGESEVIRKEKLGADDGIYDRYTNYSLIKKYKNR